MPRVYTKRKNKGGKHGTYRCGRCSEPIAPGQSYYEWSFRYGGTRRQHTEHGYPRRSQLTQSKLGEIYDAVDTAEAELAGHEAYTSNDEYQAVIDQVLEVAQQVADEYREAAEAFQGGGPNAEQADLVEEFVSELEQVSLPDEPEEGAGDEELDTWRNDAREAVQAALDAAP